MVLGGQPPGRVGRRRLLRTSRESGSFSLWKTAGVEGCLACDLAEGRVDLPGGEILVANHWIVEHCVGPLGVGTLIVKPKRHVVHCWELDESEASELGPLLR